MIILTYSEFNELVEKQLKLLKDMLAIKAGEYSPDIDRLESFKSAARLQGTTPMKALRGMMAKHTVSVYDMIEDESLNVARWDEKITDSIAYLLLLKGLIMEEVEHAKHIR